MFLMVRGGSFKLNKQFILFIESTLQLTNMLPGYTLMHQTYQNMMHWSIPLIPKWLLDIANQNLHLLPIIAESSTCGIYFPNQMSPKMAQMPGCNSKSHQSGDIANHKTPLSQQRKRQQQHQLV